MIEEHKIRLKMETSAELLLVEFIDMENRLERPVQRLLESILAKEMFYKYFEGRDPFELEL